MLEQGIRGIKICGIVLLLVAGGCGKQAENIRYVYEEVLVDESDRMGDEVMIEVTNHNQDAIRKLSMKRFVDTASIMERENMTFSEAEALLQQQFDHINEVSVGWGSLASFCVDCESETTKNDTFVSVKATTIAQRDNNSPHLGYWESVEFDFTNKKFKISNPVVQEILKEYRLNEAYEESKKVLSLELLLEDESFPFSEFFRNASLIQSNEDGSTTVIQEGQPIASKPRTIVEYDFMKVPWFANNFEGTEFHTQAGYDNVVVPWTYCIEGTYQEQRTGYWASCSKVSLRIYEMFGEHEKYLPKQSSLTYHVASSGYYVKTGTLPTSEMLTLLNTASWSAEIPTPFSLNTFWIGNGFDGITFNEIREDGTEWDYEFTKVDDSGFYVRITSIEENGNIDHSFTFFESTGFDAIYQALLNK